jgi:hypothetical protein
MDTHIPEIMPGGGSRLGGRVRKLGVSTPSSSAVGCRTVVLMRTWCLGVVQLVDDKSSSLKTGANIDPRIRCDTPGHVGAQD